MWHILSFLVHGDQLSGSLGHQDVRHKQWKVSHRFPIISSLAGAFMHLSKLMVVKNAPIWVTGNTEE